MIDKAKVISTRNDDLITYQALNARFVSHNELMWQTPVLGMTAMAFLLTIGLGMSNDWMRALAAGLSGIIALISAQLMARHSRSQINDANALWEIERHRGMIPIHAKPAPYEVSFKFTNWTDWLSSKQSRRWWLRGLLLFGLVSFTICILAIFHV